MRISCRCWVARLLTLERLPHRAIDSLETRSLANGETGVIDEVDAVVLAVGPEAWGL